MGKIEDLLTGTKILERINSPLNGEIVVIRGLIFGTYIQVGGLTQSGGILKSVWRKPLKKLANSKKQVEEVLILGLGGGTVAGLVREYWPEARITGVDLDPIMVELGRRYLGLDKYNVNVVIGDAFDFLKNMKHEIRNSKRKILNTKFKILNSKYDLVLVDLYIGSEYPKKFEEEEFIKRTKLVLKQNGVVIFNRLYYGEKRSGAVRFGKKLEKIFEKVFVVYPEANIMYLCF